MGVSGRGCNRPTLCLNLSPKAAIRAATNIGREKPTRTSPATSSDEASRRGIFAHYPRGVRARSEHPPIPRRAFAPRSLLSCTAGGRGRHLLSRVSVPEEALVRRDNSPDSPADSPQDGPPDSLIKALEGHVTTLREQLATTEARLTAAEARADLEAEKCAKAIGAFSDLADRLDELAAANQRRPWWRRLAGG